MSKDIVKIVKGNKFYFRILDFQGENKRFYVTYHEEGYVSGFDVVINKEWIDNIGRIKAMEFIKIVFENPSRSMKNTLKDLRRLHIKIKYYKQREIEMKKQKEYEKAKEIIDKDNYIIVRKVSCLNELGKVMALEYINDLLELNKYRKLI